VFVLLKVISRIADVCYEVSKYICLTSLAFMTVIMFIEVVLRYFFAAPLMWAESTVKFNLVALSYLGAGMALKRRAHIRILLVWDRFPEHFKPVLTLVYDIMVLVFFVLFTVFGYTAALATPGFLWELGNLEKKWLVMILPACGVLIILQGLSLIAEDTVKLGRQGTEESCND